MCINTYSLVGEYVLDIHHIFSQHLTCVQVDLFSTELDRTGTTTLFIIMNVEVSVLSLFICNRIKKVKNRG
jgi:hypothetical protein